MMPPRSQIFQNNQNYAVWPHPRPRYPPESAAVLHHPPAFKPHSGRVNRNKRRAFHRTGSGPGHVFKPDYPNKKDSKPPPAPRSGANGRWIYHEKRIFSSGGGSSGGGSRLTPPLAPRNTTSFLIRAKNCSGMESDSTPTAKVSPVNLQAASLSPATFDEKEAKEQWSFNSYGSMKSRIRLRPGNCVSGEDSGAVRFKMGKPNCCEERSLDKRVAEQDTHLEHLEEQNLTLKEKLLFMERQLEDMRRRVQFLETDGTTSRRGKGGAENFLAAGDLCSVKSNNINNIGVDADDGNSGNNHHDFIKSI